MLLNHLTLSFASSLASQRFGSAWEWYVIRAAGFVAAGLLMLLMLSGIGHVTGFTYRYIEPVKAWAIHKAMALALGGAIFVHMLFLVLDHYIKFTIPQVLFPFLSSYSNGTSWLGVALSGLAVTFGVLAMYGVVIIVASSLGWIDTKKKAWHWLHYTSYLVFVLVFLHGIYVGTDLKYGIFRAGWIFFGVVVMIAIVSRLVRVGTSKPAATD